MICAALHQSPSQWVMLTLLPPLQPLARPGLRLSWTAGVIDNPGETLARAHDHPYSQHHINEKVDTDWLMCRGVGRSSRVLGRPMDGGPYVPIGIRLALHDYFKLGLRGPKS